MVLHLFRQFWTTLGIFLNVISIGYQYGYSTVLFRDLKNPKYGIHLTVEEESWITSALAIGILPSFILTAKVMHKYGRKPTNLFLTVPGWMSFCFFFFANDKTMFFIGRLLGGLNNGGTIMAGSIIIGEYTCPKQRGPFLNTKTAGIALGIFLVHTTAIFCDYRATALVGLAAPLASFFTTLFWPESPFWLALKGRYEESEKSFFWLRKKTTESIKEFQLLIESQKKRFQILEMQRSDTNWTKTKLFLKKIMKEDFLKPTFIVWCIFVILDSNGRLYIAAYAVKIISAFSGNNTNVFYYIVAVDFITIAGSIISLITIKMFKRRTLLFVGGFSSITLLLCNSLYLFLKSRDLVPEDNVWVPLTLLMSYVFILNMTLSPTSLSLLGEVYPLEHRDFGTFVTGFLFSFTLFGALKVTPIMIKYLAVHGMFCIYACCMSLSLFCLYFLLPETKGKTLQEIESHFKGIALEVRTDGNKIHELVPLDPYGKQSQSKPSFG